MNTLQVRTFGISVLGGLSLLCTAPALAASPIIATNPGNAKLCADPNAPIVAVFRDAMDTTSFDSSTFTLTGPNGARIPGGVRYVGLSDLPHDLSVGSVGDEVNRLQEFLIDGGFLKIPATTGTFGPMTKAALVAWQTKAGLPASGVLNGVSRARAALAIFSPNVPLALKGKYFPAINTGVRNLAGTPIASSVGWYFTTCVAGTVAAQSGGTGSTGAQGSAGSQGIQGIQGSQGATGTQGAVGLQGPQGGATGAPGAAGAQGIQGIQGATGTQGEIGPQGAPGLGGTAGAAGSNGISGILSEGLVPHAAVKDTTNQFVVDPLVAQPITFNDNIELYLMDHSTTVNPSRIYPEIAGRYRLTTSLQISGGGVFNVWLRKNGVDVPLTSKLTSVQNGYTVLTTINVVDAVPGDYFEVMQSSSVVGAGVTTITGITDPVAPDAPAAIMHVIRQGDSV